MLSLTGLSPSLVAIFHWLSASFAFFTPCCTPAYSTITPSTPICTTGLALHAIGLGFYPFARRYSGNRDFLSFPGATKMFQFSPFAFLAYFIQQGMPELLSGRFPHSDIPGSMHVGNSPRLFAAYYVLLRFLAPKHPPYTLINLILFSFLSLPNCQRSHISFTCFFKQVCRYTSEVSGFKPVLVF